jgi:hypothetical protein
VPQGEVAGGIRVTPRLPAIQRVIGLPPWASLRETTSFSSSRVGLTPLFSHHHPRWRTGEFVGGDFLVDAEALAGDELEVVSRRDFEDGAADALHAGIALIALPCGAEEQTAILVDPDLPVVDQFGGGEIVRHCATARARRR